MAAPVEHVGDGSAAPVRPLLSHLQPVSSFLSPLFPLSALSPPPSPQSLPFPLSSLLSSPSPLLSRISSLLSPLSPLSPVSSPLSSPSSLLSYLISPLSPLPSLFSLISALSSLLSSLSSRLSPLSILVHPCSLICHHSHRSSLSPLQVRVGVVIGEFHNRLMDRMLEARLTLVHVRAQLEHLRDTSVGYVALYGGQRQHKLSCNQNEWEPLGEGRARRRGHHGRRLIENTHSADVE